MAASATRRAALCFERPAMLTPAAQWRSERRLTLQHTPLHPLLWSRRSGRSPSSSGAYTYACTLRRCCGGLTQRLPCHPTSAVLAHLFLGERLPALGWLGCGLCICGSVPLVLHAPPEAPVASVRALWALAAEPLFVWYALTALSAVFVLCTRVEPRHSAASPLPALLICSLMGSLSVLALKALGTALRLTLAGRNQLADGATWVLLAVVVCCVVTQMAYLNKALDSFPTAVVTPLYYVLFTSATLGASAVLFQDWLRSSPVAAATQACGFLTILGGVTLLHVHTVTRRSDAALSDDLVTVASADNC